MQSISNSLNKASTVPNKNNNNTNGYIGELQLMQKDFPYLLLENVNGNNHIIYHGYLLFDQFKQQFRIRVELINKNNDTNSSNNSNTKRLSYVPIVSNIRLEVDLNYYKYLVSNIQLLNARSRNCDTIHSFLIELVDITNRILSDKPIIQLCKPDYYINVIQQLDTIGFNNIHSINDNLNIIQLKYTDSKHRVHILKLELSNDYPQSNINVSIDLPLELRNTNTITDTYNTFKSEINNLQLFFNEIEDIDNNCWVLDVDRPQRNSNIRRIAIDKGISMQITINPIPITINNNNFISIPDIKLLGNESVTGPIQQQINSSINNNNWDFNKTIRNNIISITNINLPAKSIGISNKAEYSMDCGICYSYKLHENIPSITCDNTNCSKLFHRYCLVEWLKSLPNHTVTFGVVYGSCPYCAHTIGVPPDTNTNNSNTHMQH